ncbi:hypothetical protein ATK36_2181 [Amycolatopsis sulphurea]|uniref:WXG100 family type VII secretion target n=1 Tax=Amycolatopsis sulphurea TaxID=76022 RepID=A0A2A9F8M8_9PSEU|nr:hypothetical protein [Amycolatopsis sulphurea]PFG47156.1 hypothetical protein ATK36_2181 [Amycolatopsis sulphurea]
MEAERCLTAAEIYQQLTGGAGPESLGSTQRAALRLSERLKGVAERVADLAQYQRGAWHGESANEASANSCTPLMRAAMDDSLHLGIAQGAADDQLSAFQNAKRLIHGT